MSRVTYKLVPLAGDTGTQLVDGRVDALAIGASIAERECVVVWVQRARDGFHVATIEPYPALYDREHPVERLPDWRRIVWWCERHARWGRASALPLFWQMFSEGRRS